MRIKQNISIKFELPWTCLDRTVPRSLYKVCILPMGPCIRLRLSFTHHAFCDIGRKAQAMLDRWCMMNGWFGSSKHRQSSAQEDKDSYENLYPQSIKVRPWKRKKQQTLRIVICMSWKHVLLHLGKTAIVPVKSWSGCIITKLLHLRKWQVFQKNFAAKCQSPLTSANHMWKR